MDAAVQQPIYCQSKPCGLIPACKYGNHQEVPLSNSLDGQVNSFLYATNRISPYYADEADLIHDLGALKRGEVYSQDDFYHRVRTWYRAEVSRLYHQLTAKSTRVWATQNDLQDIHRDVSWETPLSQRATPTRRQPARDAKTRAAQSVIVANKSRKALRPGRVRGETKGDYELADAEWLAFLDEHTTRDQDQDPHVLSTEKRSQLFEKRVEQTVRKKLHKLLRRKARRCALAHGCEAPIFVPRTDLARSPRDEYSNVGKEQCEVVVCPSAVETAKMVISPTLGQWPIMAMQDLPEEDLGGNVVRVAGIKFVVDTCVVFTTSLASRPEAVRFEMV
ncbi:hypothetical protein GQ53DRAFT_845424 [Thozetella sp. PMI_491]|nr:hypothetical protein GQ53DRAFT_845424 [Thozetella sp. PMI_491]